MDKCSESTKRPAISENDWRSQIQYITQLAKENKWIHTVGIHIPYGSSIVNNLIVIGNKKSAMFRPLIYKIIYKQGHSFSHILELDIQTALTSESFERKAGYFYIIRPKKSVIIRRVVNTTKSIDHEIRETLEEGQRFALLYCSVKNNN